MNQYKPEEVEEKFELIIELIADHGKTTRQAIIQCGISTRTFFKWIEEDETKRKRYAHAKEIDTDMQFDSMREGVMDDSDTYFDENGNKRTDPAAVQKKRLIWDAKRWELSKREPKKFGDKLDVTTQGEKITAPIIGMSIKNESETD